MIYRESFVHADFQWKTLRAALNLTCNMSVIPQSIYSVFDQHCYSKGLSQCCYASLKGGDP